MLVLATKLTSKRASFQISRWTVRFHCQLFGIWLLVSPPTLAPPRPVPKQVGAQAVGCVRLSRKRPLVAVKLLRKGGLFPPIWSWKRRSRLKNWPIPERMAHLPCPVGSHATLRRDRESTRLNSSHLAIS